MNDTVSEYMHALRVPHLLHLFSHENKYFKQIMKVFVLARVSPELLFAIAYIWYLYLL